MKSTKKTKKAVAAKRPTAIKKTTKKVATTKKLSTTKKRAVVAKKPVARKKVNLYKPLGVFVAIGGALGLIALISAGLANLNLSKTNTSPVLGVTTEQPAPVGFKASSDKYMAKLSWTYNAPSSDYNYQVLYYDKTLKSYRPAGVVDVDDTTSYRFQYGYTSFDGTTVTAKFDQAPGEAVVYKVALCYGECRVSYQTTNGALSGWTAVDAMGSMSAAAVLKIPRLATTLLSNISSVAGENRLSWRSVAGMDGYDIYRTSSVLGLTGYVKIGSVGTDGTYSTWHTFNADGTIGIAANVVSPTTYTDKAAAPGVRYYYKIVSRKMITPLTYSKGWMYVYSNKSLAKNVVTAKIATPSTFRVDAYKKDRAYVITNADNTSTTQGFYLYCDKCTNKKMELTSRNSYIGFGGIDESGDVMSFSLSGLTQNTRYAFQLTRFKVIGGKTYESAKTAIKYTTTPNIDAPAAPTGFEYRGTIVGGGITFKWTIPTVAVEGYALAVSCTNGDQGMTKTWSKNITPYVFQSSNDNYLIDYDGYDIDDFGLGYGNCFAGLQAYNMSNGVQVNSNMSSLTFTN